MLQTSTLLADSLADRLVTTFVRSYGRTVSQQAELLGEAARLAEVVLLREVPEDQLEIR